MSSLQQRDLNWAQFEVYVSSLYAAFGYSVRRNTLVGGNQVDLLCEKHVDGLNPAKVIVECKFHEGDRLVGIAEVNKLIHLAQNLLSAGEITGAAIVTNTSFSKEAKSAATKFPLIALKTVADLESDLFDFSHLYATSVFDYEREEISQTYVSMSGKIHDLSLRLIEPAKLLDQVLLRRLTNSKPTLSIILADFGAGKSTLLKDLYYRMAKSALSDPSTRRPVFLELKNFHLYSDIHSFFHAALPGDLPRSMSQTRLNFLRESGRFVFFLDGFDELRLPDFEVDRARVFIEIREFIGEKSAIVLSCRPTYFATEAELKRVLREFIEPSQQALSRLYGRSNPRRDLANNLLRKVGKPARLPLKHGDLKIYFLDTFDENQIKEYICKFLSRPAAKLTLSEETIYQYLISVYDISDLIKRPLLLYIILYMIEHDIIDVERVQPLGGAAEIYSLYIESCVAREYEKGVARTVFTKEERKRICQFLALFMVKSNTLRVTWSEMLNYVIAEAASDSVLSRKISELPIEDISADIRVCAFLKLDVEDALRFAHKSFMEFFVAQYVYERAHDYRDRPVSLELLRSVLSHEILFFISEFVKLNSVFGDQLCGDRIIKATKAPAGISQDQFAILRRNLFAINLMSNFEKSGLDLVGLSVGSVMFSGVKMRALRLSKSNLTDITLSQADISTVDLDDCAIERAEFSDWKVRRLALSGSRLDVKLSSAEIGTMSVRGEAGSVHLRDATTEVLSVESGNKSKVTVSATRLAALDVEVPNAIVELTHCDIGAVRVSTPSDQQSLIQSAQRLVLRACRGPGVESIAFGRVDPETFRVVKAANRGSRAGLFFLDVDLWEKLYGLGSSSVEVDDANILVRAGAASELVRLLEHGSKGLRSELKSRLEALTAS